MRCSRRTWSDSGLARGVALAALITGLAAPVGAAQQPVAGALQGEVVDSAGEPLRGALVRVMPSGMRTFTDTAGRFRFERVAPGHHEIVGLMIGYRAAKDSVVVREGSTTHTKLQLATLPFRVDTLPPRVARGVRADTAPTGAETIDRVARVARLVPLRPQPANLAQRELRVWVGGGIAVPMQLLRVTDDGAHVRGEEILWLSQVLPDRNIDPKWRAFIDSVPTWLRREFHCGEVSTDTIHNRGAQPGYQNTLVAACRVQFTREPDWRAVLRELERHHVWSLPDASELPVVLKRRQVNEEVIGFDGVGVTVEAWNGSRYRAYTIGNPDGQSMPEYQDAAAILRLVITFRMTHSPDTKQ